MLIKTFTKCNWDDRISRMASNDWLNTILVLALLTITGSVVFVCFYLVKALKSFTKLVDNLEDTAEDVKLIKNQLKVKVLTTFIAVLAGLLGRFLKKRG